jgi:tetratricopeptide (TPR) repeat protein
VLAGQAAIDNYAFARAAELFKSAVEQATRAGVQIAASVTEKYGDAALQSGRYDEAEACYRALLSGNLSKNRRIDVMRRLADLEWRRGDLGAAGPALEAVMEQYGYKPPRTRLALVVRTVGQLLLFILYALVPSLWRSKPPPDVERREGMARLCNRAGEAYNLQNYLKMVFYIFSGGNMAARMGPRPAGAVGLAQVGYALGTQGKYALGHRYLDKAETHVVGGSPIDRSWLKLMSAMVYFCAGQPQSAVDRMRESEQALGKSRDPLLLQYLFAFNAAGLASVGRLYEALKAGHDLVRMGDELGDGRSKVWGRGGVARAEWRLDQLEQAARTCEEGVAAGGSNLASKLYMIAYRAMVYALRGIHDRTRVQGALDGAFVYWKLRFSVPTAVVDGATLVAVGLYWKATGDIDPLTSARVDKLIAGRTRYTRKLRMATALFLAGCATVEVARGQLERGKQLLSEAAEFAQANQLVGELIDVCLVARATLPEGDPDRQRYVEKLAELQAQVGVPDEARNDSATPTSS